MRSSLIHLFTALAAAGTIHRTNLPSWTSLDVIGRDLKEITKAGKEYQGGFMGAYYIERAETRLVEDIKQGTDWVEGQHYNKIDSEAVVTFLTTNLEPDVKATVGALIAKHDQVYQAGMTNIFHNALVSLEYDVTEYFHALIGSLHKSQKGHAEESCSKIQDSLNEAIMQFHKKKRQERGHIAERDSL